MEKKEKRKDPFIMSVISVLIIYPNLKIKRLPNVKYHGCLGKQFGSSSKKLNVESPYDPAISFVGIYPRESYVNTKTCP